MFESEVALAKHLGLHSSGGRKAVNKPGRRGGKYGVAPKERRTVAGVTYASRAEAIRAVELMRMQEAGQIIVFVAQPTFRLGVAENVYRPDFLIVSAEQPVASPRCWVEDVKGVRTAKFARDVKLWKAYGRVELRILKHNRRGWDVEQIKPKCMMGSLESVARAC